MEKHLHIVCHDIPYPLDYGGVFDIFCKIKALHQQGILIHLHCFEYGDRRQQPLLNKYCKTVHYYARATGIRGFSFMLPYIVFSRRSKALIENLVKDQHPILLEGVHSTFILNDTRLQQRRIAVRLFNVEHFYYYQLYRHAKSFFKKLYYYSESFLLKKYEAALATKYALIALAAKDARIYAEKLHAVNINYVPIFVPWNKINTPENSTGTYCLYHANLAVEENEKAAVWLIENVFTASLEVPFIIAGRNPSKRLQQLILQKRNITLVANPMNEEMDKLIAEAQLNVLPSFNQTGTKLKIVNALFNGRHCLANKAAIEDAELENICYRADTAEEYRQLVSSLYVQSFTDEQKKIREKILYNTYNNALNAEKIIALIW